MVQRTLPPLSQTLTASSIIDMPWSEILFRDSGLFYSPQGLRVKVQAMWEALFPKTWLPLGYVPLVLVLIWCAP